jgi:hypothetical protein
MGWFPPTALVTSLSHFHQYMLFKNMVHILALFGLFWLLFKKLGDFFSKSSGHPAVGQQLFDFKESPE